jgi:hypothetical protein
VACLLKVIGPDRSIIARQKFGSFSRGCDVCLSGFLAAREASRFVMATGDSPGTRDGEMEQGRATLDPAARPQPRPSRSARRSRATTATSCARTPPAAQTVRELADTRGHAVGSAETGGVTIAQAARWPA